MPDYVSVPIDTEPDDYAQRAYAALQAVWPEWVPDEPNAETAIIEAIARIAAELGRIASAVPTAVFRWFGATILNLPPRDATYAVADTTWTMIDNAGYEIPSGTLVAVRVSGDRLYTFETVESVIVPPGSLTTQPGEVAIQAFQTGAEYSGLGVDGTNVELIDSLDFVQSIALAGTTNGGQDAEEDPDYLNRLRNRAMLMSPRPITVRDFRILAQDTDGVDRALVLDNYKPADMPNVGDPVDLLAERTVTLVPIDRTGEGSGSTIRNNLRDDILALREIGFRVYVIGPTYSEVDVWFEATAEPGWDPAPLRLNLIEALTTALLPSDYALPSSGESRDWVPGHDKIHLHDLVAIVENMSGINFSIPGEILIGLNGGVKAANDLVLPGPAPLPRPGSIDGLVNAA